MKRGMLLFLIGLIVLFSGCNKDAENKELHWMTSAPESTFNVYQDIAKEFEMETGIKVSVTNHGRDLEQLLKARIASDSLPDLFSTHGWSVARYSDFLIPLTDQPWFKRIPESAKDIMTDEAGDIFVLPLTVVKDGIIVNLDVLDEVGVDTDNINDFDTFREVLKMVKDIEKTPIYVAGKDPRVLANIMDLFATGMFTSSNGNNYSNELLDGTFDWNNWSLMSDLLLSFKSNGFFNKNALTADIDSYIRALSAGDVAFGFGGSFTIREALEYNSDLRLVVIPIPAFYKDATPYYVGGEREAVGISKNSNNQTEAKMFLEFLGTEENITKVAIANQTLPVFENVEVDFGLMGEYFDRYSDTPIHQYFDRQYLPSGMWSTLQIVGNGVLSGDVTVEEASEIMKKDYKRLR